MDSYHWLIVRFFNTLTLTQAGGNSFLSSDFPRLPEEEALTGVSEDKQGLLVKAT